MPPVGRGTVTIRGVEIAVVPPSQARRQMVYTLFPAPLAEMGPDPSKGSNAPWVRRDWEASHVEAVRAWHLKTERMEAALALNIELEDRGSADATWKPGDVNAKAWFEAAERAIGEAFTTEELSMIFAELAAIARRLPGEARKN